MNFFSGTKILQKGGMFKQWETFFCLPEYVSFVSYVQINVYACVYIFKKKILSETLTSGKSKCSIPRGIDFFFLILLWILSRIKVESQTWVCEEAGLPLAHSFGVLGCV